MPYWLLVTKGYGFRVEEINMSCPADLQPYADCYVLQRKQADEDNWTLGLYIQSAVSVAVEHNFAGKKAKSKYVKQPFMQEMFENYGLTQEEIDERELRKMLLYEEEWARRDKARGLPETKLA